MKKILMRPFKVAIQEIKKDKQLIKDIENKGLKASVFPFMFSSYMYLIIMSILYLSVVYLIVGGIFINPVVFISILPTFITIWIAILLYTKVYPKTKRNYLKSIGYYNENE